MITKEQEEKDLLLRKIKVDNPFAEKLPKSVEELYQVGNEKEYNQYGASTKVLTNVIQSLGLRYVGTKLEVAEELRMANENINDLVEGFDEEVIYNSLYTVHESKGNPKYFESHDIPHDLQRPVNIVNNIITRKEESEIKNRRLDELMININILKRIRRKRSPFYFIIDIFHKIIYR